MIYKYILVVEIIFLNFIHNSLKNIQFYMQQIIPIAQ